MQLKQRRRLTAIAGAGVLTAGLIAAAPMSPAFAAPPAPIPGPQGINEVMKSDNIELLANLPRTSELNNFQTDLAFQGDYAFNGNYDGFTIYDIGDPAEPEIASTVVCPGSQNDVSVYGDLLFLSTDSFRTNDSCESQGVSASDVRAGAEYWEGMKIFDISDVENPQYIKSIETDCGSHTHTLAPAEDLESVYIYVSSYSPNALYSKCQPPHDKISVIDVPLDDPTSAAVVAEPVLFPAGNPSGPDFPRTSGCHDLTTFISRDVMAGACMGDGVLFDISNRLQPEIIDQVRDENFAFWHSATFNNEGTKVVYTDELGGGGANACQIQHYPNLGADAIYDIEGGDEGEELVFKSYYKINRLQTTTENCVAHNGSLIPVKGKDIMVQAWYQGGLSVIDFTDSENPTEIAFFERGPMPQTHPTNPDAVVLGGNWSSYWYNGHIYTSEILRGFDVHELTGEMFDDARMVETNQLNPQTQGLYTEAVSFQSLRDLIEGYADDDQIPSRVANSLLDRLDNVDEQAAKGSEVGALRNLQQIIDRANNQIKGDADDVAARDAIVAAAQAFYDDLEDADYYEQ